MMHKAKVVVCSEIHTKHSTQSEHHVEFLNVKILWYGNKPLGFKRLTPFTGLIIPVCSVFIFCLDEITTNKTVKSNIEQPVTAEIIDFKGFLSVLRPDVVLMCRLLMINGFGALVEL